MFNKVLANSALALSIVCLSIGSAHADKESKDSKNKHTPYETINASENLPSRIETQANDIIRDDKITVCHKEKESITINVNALNDHLSHGDTKGGCH